MPVRRLIIASFIAVVLLAIGAAAMLLTTVDHFSEVTATETVLVKCDFEKFRKIMVRKNATAAIVGHSGMELLEEQIQDLDVDTSNDDRPILNAILGKPKSELLAIRQLKVQLNDPYLEADTLLLRQQAKIEADRMDVTTESKLAAGRLEEYQTHFLAVPAGEETEVQLSVTMQVRVSVPKMFISKADARVEEAANKTITDQAESIQRFIAEHSDKRLILPDLKR